MSSEGTKLRILSVVEEYILQQGIQALSVRKVTEKARVNTAAIQYHFGGKQQLVEAIVTMRMTVIFQEIAAEFQEKKIQASRQGVQLSVEEILQFLFSSLVQNLDEKTKEGLLNIRVGEYLFLQKYDQNFPQLELLKAKFLLSFAYALVFNRSEASVEKVVQFLSFWVNSLFFSTLKLRLERKLRFAGNIAGKGRDSAVHVKHFVTIVATRFYALYSMNRGGC